METILGNNTVWCKTFLIEFNDVADAVNIADLSSALFDGDLEKKIKDFIKKNGKILAAGWFKNPILKIESETSINPAKHSIIRKKNVYFIVKSGAESEAEKIFNFSSKKIPNFSSEDSSSKAEEKYIAKNYLD